MISPETLRRYPFFSGLTEEQFKAVAMISNEETFEEGAVIFEECEPADKIYFLLDGNVDLYYRSTDEMNLNPAPPKEFFAESVNPGEVFAISAMIQPYVLNTTAKASTKSSAITIDGDNLRKYMEGDIALANKLLKQTVIALADRVVSLRVQLAAAQSR